MLTKVYAYEIYTKCPDTGTLGWDIERVWSTPDRIKFFPNFDCVITVDDCRPDQTFMPEMCPSFDCEF